MVKRDIIRAAKRAGCEVISAEWLWVPTPGEMVPQWEVTFRVGDYDPETMDFESTAHAVEYFKSLQEPAA